MQSQEFREPMSEPTYNVCCTCKYLVTQSDETCPNCGISHPNSALGAISSAFTLGPEMNDATRAFIGAFIGAVLGALLMQGIGVAVGVAVGVSLGILLGADRSTANKLTQRSTVSLREIERRVGERLLELRHRERRLNETRTQWERRGAEFGRDDTWSKIQAQLVSASDTLARQRDKYHIKLWEVTLIRWQNRLDPLVVDWNQLTHEECSRRLTRLDKVETEGRNFLTVWSGIDLDDYPDATRCLARLRASLDACDPLRQHLVVTQAAMALQGLEPVEDALDPRLVLPPSTAAAFQARASLKDVSSAFMVLESEYDRLRSEQKFADEADTVRQMGS